MAAHDTLELPFPGGCLRLAAGNWCHVVLEREGRTHRLGADAWKIVVERLLKGLVGPLEGAGSGKIDGATVYWVLSLSEDHATLYVAPRPGGRTLFVQDAAGALVDRIDLTEQLAQGWAEALAPER